MAIEIVVPRLGWSMDEGTFSSWLKQDGEMVDEGDCLFELESDKATQEIESFDSGILRLPADAPQSGDTVKVGQCLGYLCSADERAPDSCSRDRESAADSNDNADIASADPTGTTAREDADAHGTEIGKKLPDANSAAPPASPSVRRLARELGVDIRQASQVGYSHVVTPEQIQAVAKARVSNSPGERENGATECSRVAVSPRAAAKAAQLGVALAEITGTGRGGRIRERDVMAAIRAARQQVVQPGSRAQEEPAQLPDEDVLPSSQPARSASNSSTRVTIAKRMLAASQQCAQVTLMVKSDARRLLELRKEFQEVSGRSEVSAPSITSLFVKLVAIALQKHPEILNQWADDGLFVPDGVHIAIAVNTERGLLTPVIRNVPSLSIQELSKNVSAAIERTRAGTLSPGELQGGTFTLSNLGGYEVDGFTPILNLPQSAILGIGKIRREPDVLDGEIVILDRVSLSLTFDHRVYDGATAAAFLQTFCEILRRPGPWLM